jgi:16S rRNA (guanine966-N2)-methyltransferase
MRIIAGSAKGRPILGPKGEGIRPTSDRVRETIFNILGQWIEGRVLDLYAGTGALALESLSRGASMAVLVDSGREAQGLIETNIGKLGFAAQCELLKLSADRGVELLEKRGDRFDLIFADPPYAQEAATWLVGRLAESPLLAEGATLVIESDKREPQPSDPRLPEVDERRFGDTRVRLYRRVPSGS